MFDVWIIVHVKLHRLCKGCCPMMDSVHVSEGFLSIENIGQILTQVLRCHVSWRDYWLDLKASQLVVHVNCLSKIVVRRLVCHVDNFAAVLKNPSLKQLVGILKFPKCQFCAASIPKSKRRLQMLEIADFAAEPNWQTYLYLWRGCHGCQELPILQNLIRTANRYDNA